MALKTILKLYNEKTGEWDYISLWQLNALKLHAHALKKDDPIIKSFNFGYKYCMCKDYIVGLNTGSYAVHIPYYSDGTLEYTWNIITGTDPHLATNGEDTIIGCLYNCSKIFIFNIDTIEEDPTPTYITPSSTDKLYIGVLYVDGLWIVISATNIYYTRDLAKGFNSIRYANKDTTYARVRYNQSCVCKYGDYYYIICIGDYGECVRVKINAGNLSITKVYQEIINDFYGAAAIIPMTSIDGIGTSPAVVVSRANHYLTIVRGNSPETLNDFTGIETNIYCERAGKATGFECGTNKLSLIYNCDYSTNVNATLIDLDNNIFLHTDTMETSNTCPEIWGFDCGEYFAAYSLTSGKLGGKVYSSSNGIQWYGNFGYIYMENVDGTHNIVSSVITKINNASHGSENNYYVGDGSLEISMPLSFEPKYVFIACTTKTNDTVSNETLTITFEDRHKEIWKITGYSNSSILNTTSTGDITFIKVNVDLKTCYEMSTHAGIYGTCKWNGKGFTIEENLIKYMNISNYVYKYYALG